MIVGSLPVDTDARPVGNGALELGFVTIRTTGAQMSVAAIIRSMSLLSTTAVVAMSRIVVLVRPPELALQVMSGDQGRAAAIDCKI